MTIQRDALRAIVKPVVESAGPMESQVTLIKDLVEALDMYMRCAYPDDMLNKAGNLNISAVNPWKEAIIQEGILCEIGWDENDPRKSLKNIIDWHVAVALDPAVSSAAQALIDKGRVDFIKDMKERLALGPNDEASIGAYDTLDQLVVAASSKGCQHKSGKSAYWDYVICNECGACHTDGGWGIASNKWFKSVNEARFYKQHGRYPE